MKNKTRHVGICKIVKRLPSSKNGNPQYELQIDGYTCRTSVDSHYGYKVDKFDGRQVEAILGSHYGNLTVDSMKRVVQ